jgi:hypothetical protein
MMISCLKCGRELTLDEYGKANRDNVIRMASDHASKLGCGYPALNVEEFTSMFKSQEVSETILAIPPRKVEEPPKKIEIVKPEDQAIASTPKKIEEKKPEEMKKPIDVPKPEEKKPVVEKVEETKKVESIKK